MKKLIKIEDLRLGMYVCGFDRSWIKTPFLSHFFLIEGQQQLIKILALDIDHIYIDPEKGLDVESPGGHAQTARDEGEYMPIKIAMLNPGMHMFFELYQETESGMQLFLQKGAEYSMPLRQSLVRDGVRNLYIKAEDEAAYGRYLDSLKLAERDKRETYTAHEFNLYNKNKSLHFPLESTLLVPGTKVDFSLYSKRGFFYDPVLIVEPGERMELGVHHLGFDGELSIRSEDIPRYKDYIAAHLKEKGNGNGASSVVTRENAKIKVREILARYSDGKAVRRAAEGVVQDMVGVIMGRKGAFIGLMNLNARDMYTYSHSVNMATLAIALGTVTGLGDDQLFELGLGCLLHDIGKSQISIEILNKPDHLTMREVDILKKHVVYGRDIVLAYDDIPPRAMIPVVQHHENLLGSGYPFGIRSAEFDLFGKIASIVDLYDSITTDRPFKKALTPFNALKVIAREREMFDPALYAEFVKMLGSAA